MASEAITRNDLTNILNEVLPPTPSEYRKLLWTNPSPSSAFAAQTISVDADEYDSIEVEYNGTSAPLIMSVRNSTYYVMTPAYGGTPSYRAAKLPTTNGVYFDECHKNSGATIENSYLVPLHIYGIKYERVAPPQLEDLTIIEDLGVYNIPSTGTWTFPNVKPYKRMFICFPIWGAYNSSTLASTPIFADANQSSTTITNWTNRAGGVVTNTTVSAYVLAIRMEF